MPPRYLVIANRDTPRWRNYEPELLAFWRARGVEPEVHLVPWSLVVARAGDLTSLELFDEPALVRLESPGKDWGVTCQLLSLGAAVAGRPERDEFLTLEHRKGRLVEPLLFFTGFRETLYGLAKSFQARPHLHVLSDPHDIAEMFDKNATCERLRAAKIPIPPTLLPPPGDAESLLAVVAASPWRTAYAKLNTGSSASAIVVIANQSMPTGQSSMVMLDGGFYSSRRLATYQGDDLRRVLAFLVEQGVCVQEGIRMAQFESRNFDVRVVCIHGKPRVSIFRLSWLPMTNLHLGGQRGVWATCRAGIPTRAWLDAMDHCEETAQLYRSEAIGIDLLFEAGFQRHFILEVNAFGDFFPGLTDAEGRSIHAIELEESARRVGWL